MNIFWNVLFIYWGAISYKVINHLWNEYYWPTTVELDFGCPKWWRIGRIVHATTSEHACSALSVTIEFVVTLFPQLFRPVDNIATFSLVGRAPTTTQELRSRRSSPFGRRCSAITPPSHAYTLHPSQHHLIITQITCARVRLLSIYRETTRITAVPGAIALFWWNHAENRCGQWKVCFI